MNTCKKLFTKLNSLNLQQIFKSQQFIKRKQTYSSVMYTFTAKYIYGTVLNTIIIMVCLTGSNENDHFHKIINPLR